MKIGCRCRGPSRSFQGRRLQVLHQQQKLAQLLDSLVHVSRLVERDHKKKRARELGSITGEVRNGRLWRARTPSICE